MPALTPDHALAWLAALSAEPGPAAVLDAAGGRLAGDEALAARAAALLADAPQDATLARDGALVAVRGAHHAVAAQAGPRSLQGLLAADLWTALAALDGP